MLGRNAMRARICPFFTVCPGRTYSFSTTPDTCALTSISRRGITLPIATVFLTMVILTGLSTVYTTAGACDLRYRKTMVPTNTTAMTASTSHLMIFFIIRPGVQ